MQSQFLRYGGSMTAVYSGALTREQFLFRETRIVARLVLEGMDENDIVSEVYTRNLFQYPTERLLKNIAGVCLKRLAAIKDAPYFIETIANGAIGEAKQAALVAMMSENLLMGEFMVIVIGGKYRQRDLSLTRKDIRLFLHKIQEQDEAAAAWTEQTVEKIRQVIQNCLKETGYIQDIRTGVLQPVYTSEEFAAALKESGLRRFLPAFNIVA